MLVSSERRPEFIPHGQEGKEDLPSDRSVRGSPGARGGGSAHRRQVVVSRDVAVHWEVVVALGVFVRSVTEGTLTLWWQRPKKKRNDEMFGAFYLLHQNAQNSG